MSACPHTDNPDKCTCELGCGCPGYEKPPNRRARAMSVAQKHLRDGTTLGCIGLCKVCGKAIVLRRTTLFLWDEKRIVPGDHDAWGHFVNTDHAAVLNPGPADE